LGLREQSTLPDELCDISPVLTKWKERFLADVAEKLQGEPRVRILVFEIKISDPSREEKNEVHGVDAAQRARIFVFVPVVALQREWIVH